MVTNAKHGNESDDDENDNRDPDELYPDHWGYANVLWDGMQAETIEKAYNKQSFRDQRLLEYRNAICMHCGRVSTMQHGQLLMNLLLCSKEAAPMVQNGLTIER